MATIRDIAAMADTSIATVSNYLNGTKPVSKKRMLSICKAIESLNYIPNLQAKSLKSNQYRDIGVILPNFDDSYYVQLFQSINLAFQNTNYYLNLAFSYDIPELETKLVDGFLQKQIRGLIIITCQPDKKEYYQNNFHAMNKSIVLIDRHINNLDVNFVTFNYAETIKTIASNYLGRGYKNLFLFTGPIRFYCEKECVEGFLQAYNEQSLTIDEDHIIQTLLNKEDAFRNTITLLKKYTPEIIITTSESCAKGIIEGLLLLGKTTREIPVITLGEDHWNHYTHSFASYSVTRPAMQIGTRAVQLLLEQVKSPKTYESKNIVIDSTGGQIPSLKPLITIGKQRKTDKTINVLLLDTSQSNALLGMLPNFENKTGIHVNYKTFPHQNFFNHIIDDYNLSNKTGCSDVYMFDIPWLNYLASMKILSSISDFIRDSKLDIHDYFEGSLAYFSEYNGMYYGLPFMYAPQILYYRKDIFTNQKINADYANRYHFKLRCPQTWTEFNAITEYFTVYSNEINFGTSIAASYNEYLFPEIYTRLLSYGGDIINGNKIIFESPSALKTFINLKNTFRYAKPDYMKANDKSVVEDFLNGDTAMLITFPSFLTDIIDLRASGMKGNISYEHIPGKTPLLGGWSMGISERSRKKQDAFSFINWACTKQIGNYLPLLGGYPAITNVYTNDELIQLYPWLPLCLSAYRYAKPIIPIVSKNKTIVSESTIESIICKRFYETLEEKIEPADAIAKAQKDLENLLQK